MPSNKLINSILGSRFSRFPDAPIRLGKFRLKNTLEQDSEIGKG